MLDVDPEQFFGIPVLSIPSGGEGHAKLREPVVFEDEREVARERVEPDRVHVQSDETEDAVFSEELQGAF